MKRLHVPGRDISSKHLDLYWAKNLLWLHRLRWCAHPESWLKSVSSEDYSFTILANAFKDRTKQEWDKKFLLSFGLVTGAGHLTNAGALFADDCPLWQSRLYCTRWDGKEKGDAINDAEFTGNVLMLLREAMNFVKSNTKRGWEKLPDGRKNKPEYAERALLEAMVNAISSIVTTQWWVARFILIYTMTALL